MNNIKGSLILIVVMLALGVGVGMLLDYHNQNDDVMAEVEYCSSMTGFLDRCE